jgi:hypothetical protein
MFIGACLVLGICLAGCTGVPSPRPPAGARNRKAQTDDQAAIYATVIRYLFDPSVPSGTVTLYIVRATNDAAADPSVPSKVSVMLPSATQKAITEALGDFPTQVIWVDKFSDVKLAADSGIVIGGGVIVQVGNIRFQSDSRALVPATIYARERTTGGALYVVQKRARRWKVAGTRGGFWSTQ